MRSAMDSATPLRVWQPDLTPTLTSGDMPVLASVDVTNTGSRAGDEIVQLYMSVDFASSNARAAVPMPVKQLRGFRRITLMPGQTKTITFTLGPEELSYWSVPDGGSASKPVPTQSGGGSQTTCPLCSVVLTSSKLYDSVTGETALARLPSSTTWRFIAGNLLVH